MDRRTKTTTTTYTKIDIRKTFEGFEADFRMIARRTKTYSQAEVGDTCYDIIKLAEYEYISTVNIILMNTETNEPIRATKYTVAANGKLQAGDKAGQNMWKEVSNSHLQIVISYTANWGKLTEKEKNDFRKEHNFKNTWTTSTINTSFPNLTSKEAQTYANNTYEIYKKNYE